MGILAVLWEKWVEFKRDLYKITVSIMILPLMYLLVFSFGIKFSINGEPYFHYLIPGLIAMTTMTSSFGAIAQNMTVQRLYERALDQVMVSPTPLWQFILGQVIGGSLRGLYAAIIILILTSPLRGGLIFTPLSIGILFLNGLVFSTIALVLSFMAKNHTDAPRFNSYIIMPMSFLCNTFFSTENMPHGIREFVEILPLSQTCEMVRNIANGRVASIRGIVILIAYLVAGLIISAQFLYKKKNL
ncbi:MAG: ABC transporter permease [Pseudobutyrivibrio sp.]|nr:ABC transporter permease [Pseudobutyrivibrio sp.]